MHRKTPALTFFVSTFLITIIPGSVVTAQTTPAKSQPVLDVTSMDTTVDACTDFFAYSCGGWIKQNPIPPDQSSWSVYSKLEDDNKAILREILESAATPAPDRDAVKQKIGDYYTACMDEKAINAAAIRPLEPLLDQIQQLHSRRSIADIAAILVYNNALFRFRSDQDLKIQAKSSLRSTRAALGCRTVITISRPMLTPRSFARSTSPICKKCSHCSAISRPLLQSRPRRSFALKPRWPKDRSPAWNGAILRSCITK